MSYFAYPVALTLDEVDGGFVVTCRDFPEAITQGETIAQCLSEAADCLGEAIAGRLADSLAIPAPSERHPGEYLVPVPLEIAQRAIAS